MPSKKILDLVDLPANLKGLKDDELTILAQEIREKIIETTANNGGHVASSLGAVEIILALHSLLDAPKDKIIYDVGHQSYAHKLVTGRRDSFDTLRSYGGISGFPRPSESEYDAHPSGHASDSLSVATGYAKARLLNGTDEKIVAVIGDAALAGGMAFEALNYIGAEELPILIVLNDNEMSISRNIGALTKHFGNVRATSRYRNSREALQEKLENSPSSNAASRAFAEFGKRAKDSMKNMFIPQAMIYENMGIVCTPPINGHNITELREMLRLVLPMNAPVLLHVVTKKGVGYAPAVADPERFHGVGPFEIETGKALPKPSPNDTYTQAFGRVIVREAEKDDSIVAITAAMEGGTGLKEFRAKFPRRFIDVGIAEEQAVGMASGLAAAGKKPVVAIYSTFLQRAIDQMIVDVCLPNLPVVFALDRGGIVGDDGPTHHGVFDIAYTRMIPNMRVITPSNEIELASALHTALALGGPFAIRYPRGAGYGLPESEPVVFEEGKSETVRDGEDVAVLAFGRMVSRAVEAAEAFEAEGISVRVVDMRWAKPLDEAAIAEAAKTRLIVTVEEGVVSGGVGEGILDVLSGLGSNTPVKLMGIPDRFALQGNCELLLNDFGLNAEGIAETIRQNL